MKTWTPAEWTAVLTAVIASLGSAIASILNSVRHKELAQQVQSNHVETIQAIQKGPAA